MSSDRKDEAEDSRTKLCDFCRSEISFKAIRCRQELLIFPSQVRFCTSVLTSTNTSINENKSFSIIREEVNSGGRVVSKVYVIIKDFQLSQTL